MGRVNGIDLCRNLVGMYREFSSLSNPTFKCSSSSDSKAIDVTLQQLRATTDVSDYAVSFKDKWVGMINLSFDCLAFLFLGWGSLPTSVEVAIASEDKPSRQPSIGAQLGGVSNGRVLRMYFSNWAMMLMLSAASSWSVSNDRPCCCRWVDVPGHAVTRWRIVSLCCLQHLHKGLETQLSFLG